MLKNYFLISKPKHMLWVLKRTVSLRKELKMKFYTQKIKYIRTYGIDLKIRKIEIWIPSYPGLNHRFR